MNSMIYLKNSKGITLVELIAALALVSMVAVLIMTTLGIGIKHSIAESNKTTTQQEANLIIAKLLNEHRKGNCYYIKGEAEMIKIIPTSCESPSETDSIVPISDSRFKVTMKSLPKLVDPTREDYILVADVNYEKATYQISTKLTRYKTN